MPLVHTAAMWPWRRDQSGIIWTVVAVTVLIALCCCGGVLAFIAPDEMAAFSPFNW